jgi:carbon storage regulator CsrA
MLVLSRKRGEAITIGDDIEIQIIDIDDGKVRLGVTRPGNVAVHRSERYGRDCQDASLEVETARRSKAVPV